MTCAMFWISMHPILGVLGMCFALVLLIASGAIVWEAVDTLAHWTEKGDRGTASFQLDSYKMEIFR